MISIIDPFDKKHNPGNKIILNETNIEKDIEKREKFDQTIKIALKTINKRENLE